MLLCKLVEHSRGTWYVDKDGNIYTLLRFKNLLKRRNREYGSQAVDLESMAEYQREFFSKLFPGKRYLYPTDLRDLFNENKAQDFSQTPIDVKPPTKDKVILRRLASRSAGILKQPQHIDKHYFVPSTNTDFDSIDELKEWFKGQPGKSVVVYERTMILTK